MGQKDVWGGNKRGKGSHVSAMMEIKKVANEGSEQNWFPMERLIKSLMAWNSQRTPFLTICAYVRVFFVNTQRW